MRCDLVLNGETFAMEAKLTYDPAPREAPLDIYMHVPPMRVLRTRLRPADLVVIEPPALRVAEIGQAAAAELHRIIDVMATDLDEAAGALTIDAVADAVDLERPHAGYAWPGGGGFFNFAKREPGAAKFRDTKRIRAACLYPEKAKAQRLARKATRRAKNGRKAASHA